jgi:hypothetical protein
LEHTPVSRRGSKADADNATLIVRVELVVA